MIVKICIGSSCHLKGSYDVVEGMKEMLRKYDVEELMEELIELQASFCFGQCADGVVMRTEEALDGSADVFVRGVNKDNIEEKFLTEVYPRLGLPQP